MNEYTIFYELDGHKMKTTVEAKSQADAIQNIRERVIIHKVEPKIINSFEDIFQSFKHNKR